MVERSGILMDFDLSVCLQLSWLDHRIAAIETFSATLFEEELAELSHTG